MSQHIVDIFQADDIAVYHAKGQLERFAANKLIECVPVQRTGELIVMAHAPQMGKELSSLPDGHDKMRQDLADLHRFADTFRTGIVQTKEPAHPILVQKGNQQDCLRRTGL